MNRSKSRDKGSDQGTEVPVNGDGGTVEEGPGSPEQDETVTLSGEEFKALKSEMSRLKEQYLLAVADFDNFRKRMEREREEIVCFANEKLIGDLLPVLDNLERALSADLDKAGKEGVIEGVRMVAAQLHSILQSCGLEPVAALGGTFDPQHHEAVGVLPSGEHEEGTVIAELQKGYKLRGRILRPSMVHVAAAPGGGDREGEN